MKTLFSALLLGLITTTVVKASVITAGSNINEASALLEAKGYREGGLAVAHNDQIRKLLGDSKREEKDLENLKVWQVDQGFLVISYVVSTGSITTLSFNLYDERPKSSRKDFRLKVISFDPATAELIIQTTKK
jgi:hypothetical protein